jgi:hypothetical protein
MKSITLVSHALILISMVNILINVFFLFQNFNAFSAMIVIADIIFAFHILGSRWGMLYAACHCIPILIHELGAHAGIVFTTLPQQKLAFEEIFITLILLFSIVIYLIYYYHQAFELAKSSLYQNMVELKKSKSWLKK